MKAIAWTARAHLLVATAGLVAGCLLGEMWGVGLFFLLVGLGWLAAQIRGAAGVSGVVMYIFLIGAAVLSFGPLPGWMGVAIAVAALGAWDLDHFLQRLRSVDRVDYETGVGRDHLRRLATVEALGLAAGIAAQAFRLRLPFWWEALLVVLAVLGISKVIGFVRQQAEE